MTEMNLPWKHRHKYAVEVENKDGVCITSCGNTHIAAHIVKCVNNHDALVEALQQARVRMLDMIQQDDGQAYKEAERAMPIIDAALNAARRSNGN